MRDMLDPLRELSNIQKNLNHMFSNLTSHLINEPQTFQHTVEDKKEEIIVKCEIPNIRDEKDVIIEIENSKLFVRATIEQEIKLRKGNMFQKERHYQHYQKVLELPNGLVEEEAVAAYENGMLKISIPKRKKVN